MQIVLECISDTEIWDLYSEDSVLLGRDYVRGEQLTADGYHLDIHVWIKNSKKEVGLIYKLKMDMFF